MGWGSGATTTVGFGVGERVITTVAPGPIIPVKPSTLLLQAKSATFCKIGDLEWATRIDAAEDQLLEVESSISKIRALLHQLEQTDPLVVGIQWALDCKIDETEFDSRLASADVDVDSIESTLSRLRTKVYGLESSLRTYLRKKRIGS